MLKAYIFKLKYSYIVKKHVFLKKSVFLFWYVTYYNYLCSVDKALFIRCECSVLYGYSFFNNLINL